MTDSVTTRGVCRRVAFGEVTGLGGGLCFVPPATVLVTTAKVVARDPKKGHFGVGTRGKTNSPVPACVADQEQNFHWHFIGDTSYINANTFSSIQTRCVCKSQPMRIFPEHGNWI